MCGDLVSDAKLVDISLSFLLVNISYPNTLNLL